MSDAEKLRELIPAVLERCQSADEFWNFVQDANQSLGPDLYRVAHGMLDDQWSQITALLQDWSQWETRSHNPKDFKEHLNQVLRMIKRFMKARYRIPVHRPTKNSDRDQRIAALMSQEPTPSYGEVAVKLGLGSGNAKVVERAHKRETKRQRRDLREGLETLADLIETLQKTRSRLPTTKP